jgi:hypothetical protein
MSGFCHGEGGQKHHAEGEETDHAPRLRMKSGSWPEF